MFPGCFHLHFVFLNMLKQFSTKLFTNHPFIFCHGENKPCKHSTWNSVALSETPLLADILTVECVMKMHHLNLNIQVALPAMDPWILSCSAILRLIFIG